MGHVTATLYRLDQYNEALADKERSGGIMRRVWRKDRFWYEVRYLPLYRDEADERELTRGDRYPINPS